jgi:hypothetical protein
MRLPPISLSESLFCSFFLSARFVANFFFVFFFFF